MNEEEIQAELDKLREKQKKLLSLFIHDKIDRKKAEEVMAVLREKRAVLEAQNS